MHYTYRIVKHKWWYYPQRLLLSADGVAVGMHGVRYEPLGFPSQGVRVRRRFLTKCGALHAIKKECARLRRIEKHVGAGVYNVTFPSVWEE